MRRVLTMAVACATTVGVGFAYASAPAAAAAASPTPKLVVIYEENHSFDNLYGGWGSVNGISVEGLATQALPGSRQVDQSGTAYKCLLQLDANLVTTNDTVKWLDGSTHSGVLPPSCSDKTADPSAPYNSAFTNQPFLITDYVKPNDNTCAPATAFAANGVQKGDPQGLPGGCTRDIVHRFYQEQYQLDGGKQDRYTLGSDAAGLTQGYYDTKSLPLYQYLAARGAPNYVLADHFFQAAFGGSFLNHQYLIAAQAPVWNAPPTGKNSVLDVAGFPNKTYPLYKPDPAVAYNDGPLTQACGLPTTAPGKACGNYAVNTVQPFNRPSGGGGNTLPLINDTDPASPGYETNIGDEMSAKGVSWNWYAGGWDNAAGNKSGPGWTNGTAPVTHTYTDSSGTHTNANGCADPASAPAAQFPYCNDPLFQFHHQPFNYFSGYAPGQPGRTHLQDETAFLKAANNGTLPSVSFVKPIGEDNEHPGYASTNAGESHLVDLIKAVENGPDANNTLILVTYDEFGGSWDHVAPPGQGNTTGPSDSFGPGTRIPAIVIGKALAHDGLDHTSYDTTSILATIEHAYGLAPVGTRDAQVNDMRNVFLAANR